MSDPITIRGLIEKVLSGVVRIPKFQRGFVWEPENVAFLMDSIYRNYPIGSVLFWRSREQLTGERDLGPFALPPPEKKWPIDYVLDGQQRITSLFGVFQTTLIPKNPTDDFGVYFNLDADEGALEGQFVAASSEEANASNLFPLRLFFDPNAFLIKTRHMNDKSVERIVDVQRRFQEAKIANEVIEFDDREQIAMIFERVNRAGIPLDTFQLLTAWTWNEEFDLNDKIENLGAEVAPYGFSRIGDEQDLLLKCASAVITGDASIKTIVALHGPTVRDEFEKIKRGILGAIEFLRLELNVHSLEIMPYPAMLVPLSRFFATDNASGFHPNNIQRETLRHWFWRCCFSRRYSSGVGRAHEQDIKFMDELKKNPNQKIPFSGDVDDYMFSTTKFNIGVVNTKIFVLLLAANHPLSLISGSKIDLEDVLLRCNRNEFHHIFPKAFLATQEVKNDANLLANFCFLSAADNQAIKDKSPEEYSKSISNPEAPKRALIPSDWAEFEYDAFLSERAEMLAEKAIELCGN